MQILRLLWTADTVRNEVQTNASRFKQKFKIRKCGLS